MIDQEDYELLEYLEDLRLEGVPKMQSDTNENLREILNYFSHFYEINVQNENEYINIILDSNGNYFNYQDAFNNLINYFVDSTDKYKYFEDNYEEQGYGFLNLLIDLSYEVDDLSIFNFLIKRNIEDNEYETFEYIRLYATLLKFLVYNNTEKFYPLLFELFPNWNDIEVFDIDMEDYRDYNRTRLNAFNNNRLAEVFKYFYEEANVYVYDRIRTFTGEIILK